MQVVSDHYAPHHTMKMADQNYFQTHYCVIIHIMSTCQLFILCSINSTYYSLLAITYFNCITKYCKLAITMSTRSLEGPYLPIICFLALDLVIQFLKSL